MVKGVDLRFVRRCRGNVMPYLLKATLVSSTETRSRLAKESNPKSFCSPFESIVRRREREIRTRLSQKEKSLPLLCVCDKPTPPFFFVKAGC